MTEWKTVKIEADIGPFCVIVLGAQGDTGRDKFFKTYHSWASLLLKVTAVKR